MRVVIHSNNSEHQRQHASLMAEGVSRHGHEVCVGAYDQPSTCDAAIVWGWRQERVINAARVEGRPILVMERGHLQPRNQFVSLGWNGLGGWSKRPACLDGGKRWDELFSTLMEPWSTGSDLALVMGQVPGDASIKGVDIDRWCENVRTELSGLGWRARIRPHPLRANPPGPLADDLAEAGLVVTYNSTSGVEAVLAGVPLVAINRGSIAWPVASHQVDAPPVRPDRTAWANRLAWANWSPDEIADGSAWEAMTTCMEI